MKELDLDMSGSFRINKKDWQGRFLAYDVYYLSFSAREDRDRYRGVCTGVSSFQFFSFISFFLSFVFLFIPLWFPCEEGPHSFLHSHRVVNVFLALRGWQLL